MKISTKQIALAGLLLAVCIVSQFFKNISVFITGPIINACLILALFAVGMIPAIILCVITPVTAFLITGNPVMAAIPAMMPMIMIGNAVLVICIYVIGYQTRGRMILGMAVGSIVKALVMGLTISAWLLPMYLPEAMQPKLSALQWNFSMVQLITALIGCVIAYYLWIPLKKVVADTSEEINSLNA
ncbi:MAG: ECF transporter S component [Lachnospiraceae bacterium]|nr:ECF transporter S component [Lachnospiraceae bacterium]